MFPAPKLRADSLFATWNLKDEVAVFVVSSGTRLLATFQAKKCLHKSVVPSYCLSYAAVLKKENTYCSNKNTSGKWPML